MTEMCGQQHPTYPDIRCDRLAEHSGDYHQSDELWIGWWRRTEDDPATEKPGPRRNGAVWSSLIADIDTLLAEEALR